MNFRHRDAHPADSDFSRLEVLYSNPETGKTRAEYVSNLFESSESNQGIEL